MKQKMPNSPFATRLSGSAKETELRIRNIFQWKKRRPPVLLIVLAALIALSCGSLVSCQVRETPSGEEKTPPEAPAVSQPGPEKEEKADTGLSDTRETELAVEKPFSFAELQNYEFYFSSGVGAWATTLMIHADGSFDGVYSDSEMGVTGDGYPSGSQYYCAFEGQFTPPVKVNEYTYSTQISAISYQNEVGTSEIKNGIRYSYTGAYGLEAAESILIYLPGAPLDELPQGYLDLVGYYDLSVKEEKELPFYGLYNEAAECGFSSHDIVAPMKEVAVRIEEQTAEIRYSMENEDLTQAELNVNAQKLYSLWDYLLNRQWSLLKRILDAESMRALTAEELEWIAWKEAAVAETGAEVEGGSPDPYVTDSKAAELTRDRVYELMELFT